MNASRRATLIRRTLRLGTFLVHFVLILTLSGIPAALQWPTFVSQSLAAAVVLVPMALIALVPVAADRRGWWASTVRLVRASFASVQWVGVGIVLVLIAVLLHRHAVGAGFALMILAAWIPTYLVDPHPRWRRA